jgi:hypothetical protein
LLRVSDPSAQTRKDENRLKTANSS